MHRRHLPPRDQVAGHDLEGLIRTAHDGRSDQLTWDLLAPSESMKLIALARSHAVGHWRTSTSVVPPLILG